MLKLKQGFVLFMTLVLLSTPIFLLGCDDVIVEDEPMVDEEPLVE